MRLALIALLLCGCVAPTEPVAPERFTPPDHYIGWAAGVLICADRSPDYAESVVLSIEWYAVDGFEDHRDDQVVWGLWDNGSVYLHRDHVNVRRTVQHEIKHHLLWGDWKHRHPIWDCDL